MTKEVLVEGGSAGALRAAEILANCGFKVNLVVNSPFLGDGETAAEPGYLRNARLLTTLKNPSITTWTNTEVQDLEWNTGTCQVALQQAPRYIDLTRCTACGECVEVCPVTISGTEIKAIHLGEQPDCAVIAKEGIAPCASACPAGIPVQGYIALIGEGRYQQAYQLIHDALPFPSVCGRVCNHYCEDTCSRIKSDEPVNIMGLKRFVSDWALETRAAGKEDETRNNQHKIQGKPGKGVAIIGAGPAGLTAARDLVRAGYKTTVFDANPKAGGMMRVGIPPHRLPYDHLDLEIEKILAEGVNLKLNTWVDDIPGLLKSEYGAVLIATGAHKALKVSLENADHPDNWLSLDFLKKVCLGEKIDLRGRKVIVLGGGDVAMDAARSAVRLGKPEVRIVCRGLRASFNEIKEAEEEGVEILRGRVFKKVVLNKGKIQGVACLEAEVGEVIDGKRQFKERSGTEHLIEGDLIIWAIGQRPDFSFLPDGDQTIIHSSGGIQADERMMTSLAGVFTAGDVRRGTTFFVVDAVGEGHQAAQSIMDYLEGIPTPAEKHQLPEVDLSQEEVQKRLGQRKGAGEKRTQVQCIPILERENCFAEVELTMSEQDARLAAGRCLACGPCSECQACVEVCAPGAITHHERSVVTQIEVDGWISTREIEPNSDQIPFIPLKGEGPLAGAAAAFEILRNTEEQIPGTSAASERSASRCNETGLVVCQCSGEISHYLDTAGLCQKAALWPEISQTLEIQSACSPEGAIQIEKFIHENGLGRIILAACSCCSLDQVCYSCTYQRVRCKGNLGVYCHREQDIEFVNIREFSAYVHPRSRKKAARDALLLIETALHKTSNRGLMSGEMPVSPPVTLVVGNGAAAAVCQTALEEMDLHVQILPVLSAAVIRKGGKFVTTGPDHELRADCLVLAPSTAAELGYVSREYLSEDLFLREGIINGDDGRRAGIFVCSPALDSAVSGTGAAAEVLAWTGRTRLQARDPAAVVNPLLCRHCGTCLEVCGLGIPELAANPLRKQAWINPLLCQNCGTCAAHCPSGAIQPGTLTDLEIGQTLERVLNGYE